MPVVVICNRISRVVRCQFLFPISGPEKQSFVRKRCVGAAISGSVLATRREGSDVTTKSNRTRGCDAHHPRPSVAGSRGAMWGPPVCALQRRMVLALLAQRLPAGCRQPCGDAHARSRTRSRRPAVDTKVGGGSSCARRSQMRRRRRSAWFRGRWWGWCIGAVSEPWSVFRIRVAALRDDWKRPDSRRGGRWEISRGLGSMGAGTSHSSVAAWVAHPTSVPPPPLPSYEPPQTTPERQKQRASIGALAALPRAVIELRRLWYDRQRARARGARAHPPLAPSHACGVPARAIASRRTSTRPRHGHHAGCPCSCRTPARATIAPRARARMCVVGLVFAPMVCRVAERGTDRARRA